MPGAVEDVLSRVADAYRALREENGYDFTVKTVLRHSINCDTLDSGDVPVVMVLRLPGEHEVEWCDANLYRQKLKMFIAGYVRSDGRNPEEAGAATLGETLLSNIKRVQMADPQFGSIYCRNSKIVGDSNDAGWDNSGAFVYISVEAMVYWGASSPP